jgi:uncharacterized protein with HEPN domain
MSEVTDQTRLTHILDRIDRIQHAESILPETDLGKEAQVVFDAILYDLVVIGEAVKALSTELKHRYSLIPWIEISDMRNILAHEYFRVDTRVIRATIDKPLAQLKSVCEEALKKIK